MATVTNNSRYLSSHLDPARQSCPVMSKRPLGGTGVIVGEIGVGTSALEAGWAAVPDEEALYTLGLALDMQASLIDVAATGGEDRALSLLGHAMRQRRHQTTLCLRVAGGPEEILRRTEFALKALGTDHVDILLWDHPRAAELAGRASAWAALAQLKKQGKALCLGASLDKPEELRAAMDQTPVEVLQFPLNIFDQSNAKILDAAAAKGLGLIAVRPLDSGWLTGRYGPNHIFLDARSRWSRADKARRDELQKDIEGLVSKSGTTTTQAALQFVLSFPQISCAVASVSDWHQVVGNVDAARGSLDATVAEQLRRLWARDIQPNPMVP
jgi:aryl-alcohol dehydrogenase-like predicted oxidoreductase